MELVKMKNRLYRKKRIKLTDEEVGLGSWLYLTYKIICDDTFDSLYDAKEHYLTEHGICNWQNGCLLCHKYHKDNCSKCPLYKAESMKYKIEFKNEGCDGYTYDDKKYKDSYYWKTWHIEKYSHQERISACLKICEVLVKELKNSRKGVKND